MQYKKSIHRSLLFLFIISALSLFIVSCVNTRYNSGTSSSADFPIHSEQLTNSLRQTVGLVSRRTPTRFSCSGVIIHSRYVLTAEHCVDNDTRGIGTIIIGPSPIGEIHQLITYEMFKRTEFEETVEYEVVAVDDPLDLALLRRQGPIHGYYSVVRIEEDDVRLGEMLYAIGHPVGVEYNISHGYMSSETRRLRNNEAVRIFSSVHIFYGNSGGPLFNSRGNLVGIISMMVGTPYINSAVYLTSIQDFLSEHIPANYLR